LRALGRDDLTAAATLRLSLGRGTTAADIEFAAERIEQTVARLRALAPAA
jgi:cysteine desulfurase